MSIFMVCYFCNDVITLLIYDVMIIRALGIIQGGSVCAPFAGAAHRVKYFKLIPKNINQDSSTV